MLSTVAAVLGGAAGGLILVGIIIIIIIIQYYVLLSCRNSRSSETSSSDPSIQVGQNVELSSRGIFYGPELGARCFMLEELEVATKNFSNTNLIGYGRFGEVYKGLLGDGMVVAVKRRYAAPSQEFIEEVQYLSSVRQRNLVSLLGYCQENNVQMLIYEYVPNGSLSAHLYGASRNSGEKLEFKHRLSIASGAAKGLGHLHALNPPLVHMDFNTRNVLVDEDFIVKVADAGMKSLLHKINDAGPSTSMQEEDLFLDPEAIESGRFSVKSDVYSFGVFLLELVSGREAARISEANESIVDWGQNSRGSSNFATLIDHRMHRTFTAEGMKQLLRLVTLCLNPSGERRPPMSFLVYELDRLREKEMVLTTVMGEGVPTVTLGSQLFTAR